MDSVNFGPSIRCGDCGALLPWSRTQKHVCANSALGPMGKTDYPSISSSAAQQLNHDAITNKTLTGTLKGTLRHRLATGNQINGKGKLVSTLDWKKIQEFQKEEMRVIKEMEEQADDAINRSLFTDTTVEGDSASFSSSGSERSFSSNSTTHTNDSSIADFDERLQKSDPTVYSAIPTNDVQFEESTEIWSWDEEDITVDRKYSLPETRSSNLLPSGRSSTLRATEGRNQGDQQGHQRSQSEPDIAIVAKIAQERRRKALNTKNNHSKAKKEFDELIGDLDELMTRVKTTSEPAKTEKIIEEEDEEQFTGHLQDPQQAGEGVKFEVTKYSTMPTRIPRDVLERARNLRNKSEQLRPIVEDISTPPVPRRRPTIAGGKVPESLVQASMNRFAYDPSRGQSNTRKLVTFDKREIVADEMKQRKSPEIISAPLENDFERITCNGCKKIIDTKYEKYLEAAGHCFHVNCFRCQVCSRIISHKEPFWQDKKRINKNGKVEEGLVMCKKDYEWFLKTKIKRSKL